MYEKCHFSLKSGRIAPDMTLSQAVHCETRRGGKLTKSQPFDTGYNSGVDEKSSAGHQAHKIPLAPQETPELLAVGSWDSIPGKCHLIFLLSPGSHCQRILGWVNWAEPARMAMCVTASCVSFPELFSCALERRLQGVSERAGLVLGGCRVITVRRQQLLLVQWSILALLSVIRSVSRMVLEKGDVPPP